MLTKWVENEIIPIIVGTGLVLDLPDCQSNDKLLKILITLTLSDLSSEQDKMQVLCVTGACTKINEHTQNIQV